MGIKVFRLMSWQETEPCSMCFISDILMLKKNLKMETLFFTWISKRKRLVTNHSRGKNILEIEKAGKE